MLQCLTGNVLEKNEITKTEFTDEIWKEIIDHLDVTFNMDPDVKENILSKETVKLIAAIPFLARCEMPMRTAIIHTSMYYLAWNEGTRQYFYHTEEDDSSIDSRLLPIMQFRGGKKTIIERGMNLLRLQMIAGYERDIEKDRMNKKYNPVASGKWDALQLKKELVTSIKAVPCEDMDRIMDVYMAPFTWWSV